MAPARAAALLIRRRAAVLAGAVLLLVACGQRSTVSPAASLRVLTYNVYVGNADTAATAALIRTIDADVVALQETTPALAVELRRELAAAYPHMEFHVGPLGNGPGLLSRTPPTHARYVASTLGMNGFWIGTFTIAGRDLQIVNLHLHPSEIASRNPLEIKRAYDRADLVRVAQLDELRANLAPDLPTILLGDLNSLPDSPTLTRLAALGWRDGLAGTPAATAPTYQFHGLGFHIDHILVPADVACTDPRVLPEGPSDHFPLAATLSWPAPPR